MQKLSDQWVTDFQRFGKTNMDFAALQQKLFDLDPSDRAEDLRRLTESVGDVPQENVQTQENFLQENVEVQQGTMPVEGDYNLNDFAALAGVTLNEDWRDAAKRGWDNHNSMDAIGLGKDSIKKAAGFGPGGKKDKKEKPAAKVAVKKAPVATAGDWKGFLKQHTAQLQKISADPKKKAEFDKFMAKMDESVHESPKPKMPKTRNPVASHAQSSGSGVHTDQNKKKQPMRKDKHKKQLDFATESIKEMLYRKLNAKK